MADLTFRTATTADAPAVAALLEQAYRGEAAAAGWTNETGLLTGPRSSEREVTELLADADSEFVLAEVGGALAGAALVQRRGESAYFGMFGVDPAQQGAGVGRALLAACEQTARDLWGSTAMTMTVISVRTDIIGWYERRGYARTGAHLPFPFHEHSGALRTDFDLAELRKEL